MTSAPDDPLVGTTLGHYRIDARLGAGAMGVVYRARDQVLERDVALKLLPAMLPADDTARAALLREARNASRLNHPNIGAVYEVGEDAGRVFIAMELVDGLPLRERIPAEGLPDETVLRWGAQLARALAHAHEQGVVHRDIKSANVVVDAHGKPKLLDFGLSRRTLDEARGEAELATSAGVVVGTPQYLAPELLMGGRAGVASDQWALGCLLYEMCAGHLPFTGPSVGAVVTAALQTSPEPPPERVSPGLRAIVLRCLAKEPAQRWGSVAEVAAALEALLSDSGGARALAPPRAASPGRARRRHAAVAAVLLIAAIAAALWFGDPGRVRSRWFGRPRLASIAVLPLEYRPPDPAQEYFADGMTEQLIGTLAQVRGLGVISRTSVMRFKGSHLGAREIARQLDADALIEGSIQRDGDTVRIQARLIDGASERELWAGSFDRPVANVLALQSDVAQEVTERVRARLSGEERERLASASDVQPEAFEHYLRGRYALSGSRAREAIAEFAAALAIDSLYARADAGLAHALVRASANGDTTADAVRAPALAAARRAVAHDPRSAESYLALADVLGTLAWDMAGAEAAAGRALELAPGDAEAHHTFALAAGAQGRIATCIAETQRASELDPLNPYYQQQAGEVLIDTRRTAEAVALLGKTVELFPGYPQARVELGRALIEQGDLARAIAVLDSAPVPCAQLGRAYALAGRTADARRMRAALLARWPEGRDAATDLARVALALGERDEAFRWLARARERRERAFLAAAFDPGFDPLHRDPRWRALGLAVPAAAAAR